MNSMSKKYNDGCAKETNNENNSCPTILKCGCPRTTNVTTTGTTYTVASVNANLDEICNPRVKVDFSANFIVTTTPTANATLTFQLNKQYRCCSQLEPVGSAYTVTVPTSATAGSSSIISFFICDSDLCGDNCFSYVLTATTSADVNVTLSNANLAVTATCDRPEKCCKSNNCGCNCGCGR